MDKEAIYESLEAELVALLEGASDPVSAMANAAAAIHVALPYASWTGFYRVVAPQLLRVGPFQGPVACIEIRFGAGVCGTAAQSRETQVVADVHAFEGHIACDPAARSEIVIPLHDDHERLVGVLDVDSHEPGAFDDRDRRGLETVAEILKPHLTAA